MSPSRMLTLGKTQRNSQKGRSRPFFGGSTECTATNAVCACFLRLTDTVSLHVADGYTVDDIVLYWEGHENAIQGTEDLRIPRFSFLGKTMSNKQVLFYTGRSHHFLVPCLLPPLLPW